jgi:hypothetical protein
LQTLLRIVQGVKKRRVLIGHGPISVLQTPKYESMFSGFSGERTGGCGAATAASIQPDRV